MSDKKIATELDAQQIGKLQIPITKTKGVTKKRATELNCKINSTVLKDNQLVKKSLLSKLTNLSTYSIGRYNDGYTSINVSVTVWGNTSVDASTKPNVVKGSYVTISFNGGNTNILEWGFCDYNGNNYEKQTSTSFYMPAKDIYIKIVSTSKDPVMVAAAGQKGCILGNAEGYKFIATPSHPARIQLKEGTVVILQSVPDFGYIHTWWSNLPPDGQTYDENITTSFILGSGDTSEIMSNYKSIIGSALTDITDMEYIEPLVPSDFSLSSSVETDDDVTIFNIYNSNGERTLMYTDPASDVKKTVSNCERAQQNDGLYGELEKYASYTPCQMEQFGMLSPTNEYSVAIGTTIVNVLFRINITQEPIASSDVGSIFSLGDDGEILGYADADEYITLKIIPYCLDSNNNGSYVSMCPFEENSINSQSIVTETIQIGSNGSFSGEVSGGYFVCSYTSDLITKNILCNYYYQPNTNDETNKPDYQTLCSSLEIQVERNGYTSSRFIDFDYTQTNRQEKDNLLPEEFTVSCTTSTDYRYNDIGPLSLFTKEQSEFNIVGTTNSNNIDIANSRYDLDRAIQYASPSVFDGKIYFTINYSYIALDSFYITMSSYLEQLCLGDSKNYKLQSGWDFNENIDRGNGLLLNNKGVTALRSITNIYNDSKYDNGTNIQLSLGELLEISKNYGADELFSCSHDENAKQINFCINLGNIIDKKYTNVTETIDNFKMYISFASRGILYVFTSDYRLVTTYNEENPAQGITRYPRPVRTISEWAQKNEDSFVANTDTVATDGDRFVSDRRVVVIPNN